MTAKYPFNVAAVIVDNISIKTPLQNRHGELGIKYKMLIQWKANKEDSYYG